MATGLVHYDIDLLKELSNIKLMTQQECDEALNVIVFIENEIKKTRSEVEEIKLKLKPLCVGVSVATKAQMINDALKHIDSKLESDYHMVLKKIKALVKTFKENNKTENENENKKPIGSKIKKPKDDAKQMVSTVEATVDTIVASTANVEPKKISRRAKKTQNQDTATRSYEVNSVIAIATPVPEEIQNQNIESSNGTVNIEPSAIERHYPKSKNETLNTEASTYVPIKLAETKQTKESQNTIQPFMERNEELLDLTSNQIDLTAINFYSNMKPCKKPNVPSFNLLNEKCKQIQIELSEAGKYVYWKEIFSILFEQYKCASIGEIGISRVFEIETIRELIRLQQKIDGFIIGYQTLPYITLIELEKALCNFLRVTSFAELYVGPLVKNNLVRKLFDYLNVLDYEHGDTYGVDIRVKSLSYVELFKCLKAYLDQFKSWYNYDVKLGAFEEYLRGKYLQNTQIDCLAVKIYNFGSMVYVLKNARRTHIESSKNVNKQLESEFMEIIEQEKLWLKKRFEEKLGELNGRVDGAGWLVKRAKFLDADASELLNDILIVLDMNSRKLNCQSQPMISEFLRKAKSCTYLKYILQIGFCLVNDDDEFALTLKDMKQNYPTDFNQFSLNILNRLTKKLNKKQIIEFFDGFLKNNRLKILSVNDVVLDDEKNEDQVEEANVELDDKSIKNIGITRNELFDVLGKELIQHQTHFLRLNDLVKLEERLLHKYSLNYFTQFQLDLTFLEFIVQNEKAIFEKFGIEFHGSSGCGGGVGGTEQYGGKINKNDVLAYLKQIYRSLIQENENMREIEVIGLLEKSVCLHYSVKSVKDLGIAGGKHLLDQLKSLHDNDELQNDNIIFENSLFDINTTLQQHDTELNVDTEKEALIKRLIECPLLENLNEYLQWDEMYSKLFEYKNLKDFVNDEINKKCRVDGHNKQISIKMLETSPGYLLKLTCNTSIEQLKMAIESFDSSEAAGHLVSLIAVKYQTFSLAPCTLIANQMQSAFSNCRHDVEDEQFYTFVLKMLHRIPLVFAKTCLIQFFIEPLVKVEGSGVTVKTKLYEMAGILMDKRLVNRLELLGKLCGVCEWQHSETKQKTFEVERQVIEMVPKVQAMKIAEKCEKSTEIRPALVQTDEQQLELLDQKSEIDHIRRVKYGIGIDLNDSSEQVTNSLKGMIGRSLERLSNELYNKDIHFVLELIQNADDNSYETTAIGTTPTLVFLIEPEKITLFNNEVGFKRRNIEAICDIGTSTKGKHQHGYIGRKGIGFKSVFTVTNEPEIHSNGYHIKFDTNNGSIGYILPQWHESQSVEDVKQFLVDSLFEPDYSISLNTCICLPLKPENEIKKHKSRCLTSSFKDIQPSLLLFLNRLRDLYLITKTSETVFEKRHYKRVDINENCIEIKYENKTDKWLIARETVQVPESVKPIDDIESTDICLAFPLYPTTATTESLPKLDVFAYLPLRSFGFSFIIQADFEVPASRQDIIQDNQWNQWICKHVPKIFVNSLKIFENLNNDDKITALIAYLKYVPLETEIVGFFQHVASEIIFQLRNEAILPVVACDGEVMWKKPYECIILKDMFIRDVLTCDMLQTHLSRYYLHSKLLNSSDVNQKLLQILGVHILDLHDILDILKGIFKADNQTQIDVKYMANWLVVLQRSIGIYSLQDESSLLEQVKQLKFIPLQNGDVVSLDTHVVFFPNKTSDTDCDLIYDLNIINLNLLMCLDDVKNSQIFILLKKLGVKALNTQDVIDFHIMPQFERAETVSEADDQLLVNYVVYLFKCWTVNRSSIDLNKLKGLIRFKTNLGMIGLTDGEQQIYLSELYGVRYNFEKLLPDLKWCLIDGAYIVFTAKLKNAKIKWLEFFAAFGIDDRLKLTKTTYKFTHEEMRKKLPDIETVENQNYIIDDYICEAFDYYTKNKVDQKVSSFFVKIFEENWAIYYSRLKLLAIYEESKNELKANNYRTSFFNNLKNSKWIYGKELVFSLSEGNTCASEVTSVYKPNELYVYSEAFYQYYGYRVAYAICTSDLEQYEDFYLNIGLRTKFDFGEFLSVFQTWCLDDTATTTTSRTPVYVSLGQMKMIYSQIALYLNNPFDLKMTQRCHQLIADYSIIFVPATKSTKKSLDEIRYGHFYRPSEVVWWDSTRLFEKYKPEFKPIFLSYSYLEYKNEYFKQIFLNNFGVRETPSNLDYVKLIEHIGSLALMGASNDSDAILSDVYIIYEYLTENAFLFKDTISSASIDLSVKDQLLHLIQDKRIFPCYNNKWASLKDAPLLVDDLDLAENFANSLKLMRIPTDTSASATTSLKVSECCNLNNISQKALVFLQTICELQLFSKTIKQDYENLTTNLKLAPTVQNLVRKFLPYIQSFLFSKKNFKQIYENCVNAQMADRFKTLKCFSVKELEAVYHYKYDNSVCATVSYKHCCVRTDSNWTYYVRADVLDDEKEILKGFLKIFIENNSAMEKELSKFVLFMYHLSNKTLSRKDQADIECDFEISLTIPSSEALWRMEEAIEKPVIVVEEPKPVKVQGNYEKPNRIPISVLSSISYSQQNVPTEASSTPFVIINPSNNIDGERKHAEHPCTVNYEIAAEVKMTERPRSQLTDKPTATFEQPAKSAPLPGKTNGVFKNTSEKIVDTQVAQTAETIQEPEPRNYTINSIEKMEEVQIDTSTGNSSFLAELRAINVQSDKDKDYLSLIGRWGELWVYLQLRQQYSNKTNVSITWINEKTEMMGPYDIHVVFNDDNNQMKNEWFIEVKSTIHSDKTYFPVSIKELLFAVNHPKSYFIYRLYNAGSSCDVNDNKVICKIIDDVPQQLYKHSIELVMFI